MVARKTMPTKSCIRCGKEIVISDKKSGGDGGKRKPPEDVGWR